MWDSSWCFFNVICMSQPHFHYSVTEQSLAGVVQFQVCDFSRRGRQRQCAWKCLGFHLISIAHQIGLTPWSAKLFPFTAFMLQELFSLNQLKLSTEVLLKIVMQSFSHPVYSVAESQLFCTSSCVACRSGLEDKLGLTWNSGCACAVMWHSRTLLLLGHNHTLPIGQLLCHLGVR